MARTTLGATAVTLVVAATASAPELETKPSPSGVTTAIPVDGDALAQAAGTPLVAGEVQPGRTGGGSVVGPVELFEGISNAENTAVGAGRAAKPDPVGDVGPSEYVQWVNYSFAVYTKTGQRLVGPLPGNRLWRGLGNECETTNRGDPIVLYDELADRWVLTQFAWRRDFAGEPTGPFFQCVAVSRSPDPTGEYVRYAFRLPGDSLPDYPKLALWPSAYVLVTYPDLRADRRAVSRVFALDRAAMLRGDRASAIEFALDRTFGRALPVDLDGEPPPVDEPAYVVRVTETPPRVELWGLSIDFRKPEASSFQRRAILAVDDFDADLCTRASFCIPQPEPASHLDDLARRLMFRAAYRRLGDGGAIVVNHTVEVDGTGRAGIRWYELRGIGTTPSIRQQGTYAPDDADSRWTGSIALDRTGGIALGYSVSGPRTFPSIAYTGRLAGDPLGQMTQQEGRLATGSAAQLGGGGWGDYSNLVVDPVDGCTFWYTQSYYRTPGKESWRTTIGSFRLAECGSLPVIEGTTFEGQTLRISDGPWASNASRYRFRRCDRNGASCHDIADGGARDYTLIDRDVGSTLRVVADASTDRGHESWMSHASGVIGGAPRDLVVAIRGDRSRLRARQAVRLTVDVSNRGEAAATGVTVRLALPPGAQPESLVADGATCTPQDAPACTFAVLRSGESGTLQAEVALLEAGPATVGARVAADQPDEDPETNEAEVRILVRPRPAVRLPSRPLRLRLQGRKAVVTGTIARSEAMQVAVALERHGRRVDLLAGSTLGAITLRRRAKRIETITAAARPLSFRLVVRTPPRTRAPLMLVVRGRAADRTEAHGAAVVTWARTVRRR